tara:strand:+ start:422 stop:1180 length:759 start_codon:yes stop_codon:yes gene_type:complete
MNYLVGDIGNTLTKISILNKNFKIIRSYDIESSKLKSLRNKKIYLNKFLKKNIYKKILFSSVVPVIYLSIKNFFKNKGFKVNEIKDLKLKKIIKINITRINEVGSDRLANSIGAYEKYKRDCLVIDFGTATTFDIINYPGVYEGGVIAPGIKLSLKNLSDSTALLPFINLKVSSKVFGKNTKEAINAGILWGYQGLINNIIDKIFTFKKRKPSIILTGGYAKLFKKYIKEKSFIDENITIKGIIIIYKKLIK